MIGPLRLPHHLETRPRLSTDLAHTTWMLPRLLPCTTIVRRNQSVLMLGPTSPKNQSAMTGLSDRLSSLRRNTAVRLNVNVARQLCTPS